MPDYRRLDSWAKVKPLEKWESILIGNGASMAVWDGFSYASLYQAATSGKPEVPLHAEDVQLFSRLKTRNFEQVLSRLLLAEEVAEALGEDPKPYRQAYERIRAALVAAVQYVHIPWMATPDDVLATIRETLAEFRYVFSTNYDLLDYWAIMETPEEFLDFFWGKTSGDDTTQFHSHDVEVWASKVKTTRILYPHGALHLVRTRDGETHKLCYSNGSTILDRFGEPIDGEDVVPLIVTEGTSDNKIASIQQSDYLSFALSAFSARKKPMVVFGHSLGTSDDHLVEAITMKEYGASARHIAIAVRPGSPEQVRKSIDYFRNRLPDAKLTFFNSETFPLGDPALKQKPLSGSVSAGRFTP